MDHSSLDVRGRSTPSESVAFESTDAGLRLSDRITRQQLDIRTDLSATPTAVSTDCIDAPVSHAVSVDTRTVAFDRVFGVDVREANGEMVSNVKENSSESFGPGSYLLQVLGPAVLYVAVRGTVTVTSDTKTEIRVDSDAEVVLGSRSFHGRPSATVTTTDAVEDLMAAVSTFGSALKTLSPERSWPTLRGHPPAVEVGEQLSIPDGLAPPAADLRIEVPRDLRSVYAVAPLSYYFGCPVAPGDRPRIVGRDGEVAPLDDPDLETAVDRTLRRTFFLDCLVRTEGLYRHRHHERRELEPGLDLDFADLYDRSQERRLRRYLDVPYERLEPYLPEWEVVAYVDSSADLVELLPYLVDDLAIVKSSASTGSGTGDSGGTDHVESEPESAEWTAPSSAVSAFSRSGDRSVATACRGRTFVEVPDDGALESVWAGSAVPIGGNKALLDAYENDLDRSPNEGPIEVGVVCNDEKMADELDAATGIYGTQSDFPFAVSSHQNVSTDGLATLLERGVDFLHYVGHANDRGIECPDGWLDVDGLDEANVEAFLLNACRSYDQGVALVEHGAVGGVATVDDVPNTGAIAVGRTMAQLLNYGYTIRAALDVVQRLQATSREYIAIGDGGHAISQWDEANTGIHYLERLGDDRFRVKTRVYPVSSHGLGTSYNPYIEGTDFSFTNRTRPAIELGREELVEWFDYGRFPLVVDGGLRWSSDLDPGEL